MRTGNNGQAVISWTQTELDGLEDAPLVDVAIGSSWCWRGRSIMLNTERYEAAEKAISPNVIAELASLMLTETDQAASECARIEFSNGAQKFVAELAMLSGEAAPVLIFENGCPDPGQEFWISAAADKIEPVAIRRAEDSRVIMFPASAGPVHPMNSGRAAFVAE